MEGALLRYRLARLAIRCYTPTLVFPRPRLLLVRSECIIMSHLRTTTRLADQLRRRLTRGYARRPVFAALVLGAIVVASGCMSSNSPGVGSAYVPSGAPGPSVAAGSALLAIRSKPDAAGRTSKHHPHGITYGIFSPAADPGSTSQLTFGNSGGDASAAGAIIDVQGQTIIIPWQCEEYQDGVPVGPCPAGFTTNFYTLSEPSAFSDVSFNPSSVSAGNLAFQFFTSNNGAQPSVYGVNGCDTVYYQNYQVGGGCVGFYVEVVSQTHGLPTPPPLVGFKEKLKIAPAGLGNAIIPGQGHLYIAIYLNGAPYVTNNIPYLLQAGCDTPGINNVVQKAAACTTGDGSYLKWEPFQQLGLRTDPSVDISNYTDVATLVDRTRTYRSQGDTVPTYRSLYMNSNSWAYGLLLASGVPSSVADGWVSTLKSKSGLSPTAYEKGSKILPCFGVDIALSASCANN